MDLEVIEHFRRNPNAMTAFDTLANRYGQNLEAAFSPKGFGFDDCVIIRHSQTQDPVGVIYPDGRLEEI